MRAFALPCHPPHCYLFDELSSVVGLTDSNGTLVSTYQYDSYGNLTSSTGSATKGAKPTKTTPVHWEQN